MIKDTNGTVNSSGVVKSVFWKAGERILVQGLGIIIQIVLARILLPEDFASLAIINAIISYLGLFVQSGLSVAVVQRKNLSDKDISTLAVISLLVALVLFICLYIIAPFISNYYNVGDLTWPIRVMGISLFLFSFNNRKCKITGPFIDLPPVRSAVFYLRIFFALGGMGIRSCRLSIRPSKEDTAQQTSPGGPSQE